MGRRWRERIARALTVVGVVLLVLSIAATFVERQALDTGEVEDTARRLADDAAVREQVAATLTELLFARVDVQAELQAVLPPAQQTLAGALTGALRPVAERLANEILQQPRLQRLWVRAVGTAQRQVVRLLDGEARFLETTGGVVVLDLRPLLLELTEQLPIAANLRERLGVDAGVVRLFDVSDLETAQHATRLLRLVADWIWVPALAAWVAAVWLARDRRSEVRAIALGLVVAGVLLLAIRRFAGSYIVDELSSGGSPEDAARRAWEILTRLLADAAWAAIAVGAIAVAAAWLVGPGAGASSARAWVAPHLRRAEIVYGVAAFLFVLLLLWGPVSYVQRPLTVAVLAVLAAVGIEALRRLTLREAARLPAPP